MVFRYSCCERRSAWRERIFSRCEFFRPHISTLLQRNARSCGEIIRYNSDPAPHTLLLASIEKDIHIGQPQQEIRGSVLPASRGCQDPARAGKDGRRTRGELHSRYVPAPPGQRTSLWSPLLDFIIPPPTPDQTVPENDGLTPGVTGALKKYQLDYESIRIINPR